MTLVLSQQVKTQIPIEVAGITPDKVVGMPIAEIEKLPIWLGRQRLVLAELFKVSGANSASNTIVFEGNLDSVHSIGLGMKFGLIRVESDAGRHVGRQMSGGRIVTKGDVSDYLGVEMTGGVIHVLGNAGDLVGGHLPGSKSGMNRGSILVAGNVGKGAGQAMRRGSLAIGGNACELVGWNMLGGTIVVFGECGEYVGAEMKRGTIVLAGGYDHHLLPTFTQGGNFHVPILSILANWLCKNGFELDDQLLNSRFRMFHGDWLQGGRGELFLR